jgi:translocation and assembly module TamB
MRGARLLALLVGLFAVIALGAVPLASALKNSDLYASRVRDALVEGVRSSLGCELELGDVSGNPIRGYEMRGIRLSTPSGGVVLEAEEGSLHLSIPDLMRGEPRLSVVRLGRGRGDLDLMRSLTPRGPRKERLPFDEVRVKDLVLTSSGESLEVNSARVRLPEGGYLFALSGGLSGLEVNLKGEVHRAPSGGGVWRLDLAASLGDGKISISGVAGDRVDLAGRVTSLWIDDLRRVRPFLPASVSLPKGIQGRVTASFNLRGSGEALAGEGEGNVRDLQVAGYLVEEAKGAWSADGRAVTFRVTAGRVNGAAVSGVVLVPLRTGGVSLDLKLEGVSADRWRGNLPWLEDIQGDRISADVRLALGASPSGTVRARAQQMTAGGEELEGLDITAKVSPKGADLSGACLWTGARLAFSGQASSAGLSLSGTFSGLDLARLGDRMPDARGLKPRGGVSGRFYLQVPRSGAPVVRVLPSGGAVTLEGSRGTMTLGGLGGELVISRGGVSLRSLSFLYRGGRFTLDGSVPSGDGGVRVKGRVTALPASALAEGARGSLSGTFSATGPVSSPSIEFSLSSHELSTGSASIGGFSASGVLREGRLGNLVVKGNFMGIPLSMSGGGSLDDLTLSGSLVDVSVVPLLSAAKAEVPISGRVSGKLSARLRPGGSSLSIGVSGGRLEAYGLPLTGLSGTVASDGAYWRVTNLSGSILGGRVSAGGAGGPKGADLTVALVDLNLEAPDSPLKGLASGRFHGEAKVSGPMDAATVSLAGNVKGARMGGISLGDLSVAVQGSGGDLNVSSIRGQVGEGVLEATGNISLRGGSPRVRLSIQGKGLDVSKALSMLRFGGVPLSGRGDVEAQVAYRDGLMVKGAVTFSPLVVRGLRMDRLRLPFIYGDGYLTVESGSGSAYGGTVEIQFSREMKSTRYGGNLTVKGFQLGSAWGDMFPDVKFKGDGSGDLALSLQGDLNRTSTRRGRGKLSLRDGKFSGFDPSVASAMGADSVKYRDLSVSYELDGVDLVILPGSRISSPPGDKLYRYMMFDGTVRGNGELNISCYGNLNSRGLNALSGVIGGIVSSGLDTGRLLRGILGGAVSGWASGQFRDVSFKVVGAVDKPTVSSLKVYSPSRPTEQGPAGGGAGKDERRFDLKIEVPSDGGGDQVGGQLQEQILDNLFNLLTPQGTNGN